MGPVSHAAQVVEKVFVAGRVLVLTRFKMSNMSNSFGGRGVGRDYASACTGGLATVISVTVVRPLGRGIG
jgi:hypothetical protein